MAVTGVPMLPPTCAGMPDSRRMCPTSAVVVVLPLVPVMPMVRPSRNGAASSTSPITRTPRAPRGLERRKIGGHAGGDDDHVVVGEGCWVTGCWVWDSRLLREGNIQTFQRRRGFGQLRERLQIGGAHDGALAHEEVESMPARTSPCRRPRERVWSLWHISLSRRAIVLGQRLAQCPHLFCKSPRPAPSAAAVARAAGTPGALAISSSVSNSEIEPWAMDRKFKYSLICSRQCPSAMFAGIETAARRSWLVSP